MSSKNGNQGLSAVSPDLSNTGFVSGMLKKQFRLADSKPQTIMTEIWAGIVMYLVSLYILNTAPMWQAGVCPGCYESNDLMSAAGYTAEQYRTLSGAAALATGISTLVMGLFGNMPIVVAPGLTGVAMQPVSAAIGPAGAKAGALIVGLLILGFSLLSKKIKIISAIPEDYRLGMAAGKGGVIALIALRNAGLVSAAAVGYNAFFNYEVILAIAGFSIIILAQARKLMALSFVGEILVITLVSLIIRASNGQTIVTPMQSSIVDLSLVAGVPSFDGFVNANGYILFRYVIGATLHTLIDIIVTVTAIILMCVVRTNIGYDKETFTSVLSESTKCYNIYLCISVCQVLVSPFLGVAPVTPFIQSTAGILVGARTGLSATVTGFLFLMSTLFASPIASVIPLSAIGPVVFVSCLPVVQALKYIDFGSPTRTIPAFLAFFLMTFTNSIGVGVSYSFIVLFTAFAFSPDWNLLTPHMVCTFFVCVFLLLLETNLVHDVEVLGIIFGSFFAAAVVLSLLMTFAFGKYFVGTANPGLVTNSNSHPQHSDTRPRSKLDDGGFHINNNRPGSKHHQTRPSSNGETQVESSVDALVSPPNSPHGGADSKV